MNQRKFAQKSLFATAPTPCFASLFVKSRDLKSVCKGGKKAIITILYAWPDYNYNINFKGKTRHPRQ